MSASVELEPTTFWRHLKRLFDSSKSFSSAQSCVAVAGIASEDSVYRKTSALQLWLFGYELANTVMAFSFTTRTLHVLCGKKAFKLFAKLGTEKDGVKLELMQRQKGENEESYAKLIAALKTNGSKAAMLKKEKQEGPFAARFIELCQEKLEVVEAMGALGDLLAVKDAEEQKRVEQASNFSSAVLREFLIPEMEEIIDEEKKVKHSVLSEQAEDVFMKPSKVKSKISPDSLETCYTPIIQSGGQYSLKPSHASNDEFLHSENGGTVLMSLGARYKGYCSNIARTFFFDPSPEQQKVYEVTCAVYAKIRETLRHNTPLKNIWDAAIRVIRNKKPELESKFSKNCGFGIGLEFRESTLVINRNNVRQAKAGMVFNICVGFEKLTDQTKAKKGYAKAAQYACILADTMVVGAPGKEPKTLTHHSRAFAKLSYSISDESEEEEAPKKSPKREASLPAAPPSNGVAIDDPALSGRRRTRASMRSAQMQADMKANAAKEAKRDQHQEELLQKRLEALRKRVENHGEDAESDDEDAYVEPEAYSSVDKLPASAPAHMIHVDQKAEAVLIPLNGMLVPFHISTVKNVNFSQSGTHAYLRMNFVAPTSVNFGRSVDKTLIHHQNEIFIREVTYRARNGQNLRQAEITIKHLKKMAAQRVKEKRDRDSLVEQEDLVITRDAARAPRLRELKVKPQIGGKRKSTGTVIAHVNGFRYMARTTTGMAKIDIIYNNIKHAIFHEAKNRVAVVIHFHLRNPIMVGRKKTKDIQLYVEVIDTSQDIDSRGDWGDQDGLQEERRERAFRNRMNKLFRDFVRQAEQTIARNGQVRKLRFDIPYDRLMFSGVPSKSATNIYPTLNCIVALEDTPPFVLTLKEVELAHFERVQFHLREFDLVFVFKDFKKTPMRIDAIPQKHLEAIKAFLDDAGILFYSSNLNLDWKSIMKIVTADLEGFLNLGGWSHFLGEGKEDEEGGEQVEMSEGEDGDAYKPDGDEAYIESNEDEDEYASASSEVSENDDEDLSDEYEDEESEEEGEDWDDLHKKAALEDRKALRRLEQGDVEYSSKRRRVR